jgi:uncharacterized protein (DUF2252 family)
VLSRILLLLPLACAPAVAPREAQVAAVLARADLGLLRTRPAFVEGKYRRMASSLFDFYRGNLPLFRSDWELGPAAASAFSATLPVDGLGDPHPENFGVLAAGDASLALEPNDFDSADRVPYLFDLRRLLIGLELGAGLSGAALPPGAVARAGADAYARAVQALAGGAPPTRFTQADGDVILDDLLRRSARDLAARAELDALTVLDADGKRRLVRGALDPAEPTQANADLPAFVLARLPQLLAPLGNGPEWTVLDAVRQFGSGVASWPRVRMLVLVRGPTDAPGDDVVLEAKELAESSLAGWYPGTLTALDTPTRIDAGLRRGWSRRDADPLWYTTTWLGMAMQVRSESEGQKNVRVARWTGARGTPAALTRFAATEGALLARVHAGSDPTALAAVARAVAAGGFAAEQEAFAAQQADRVREDYAWFQNALRDLGPTLGVARVPGTEPSPDVRQLLGTPP